MCASTFVIELAYHFADTALGYHIAMAQINYLMIRIIVEDNSS